jgi:hypothetical protein
LLHFRIQLFKSAYRGVRRTLMQPRGQLIQLPRRSHRVSFYTAIVQVPHPARHADHPGLFFNEPAETDALHLARYEPAPCRLPVLRKPCPQ